MESLKAFWNPDLFEKYENKCDVVIPPVVGCYKDRSNYHILNKIGEGTYGVVCKIIFFEIVLISVDKAQDKTTKKLYALKRMRPETEDRDGFDVTVIRGM